MSLLSNKTHRALAACVTFFFLVLLGASQMIDWGLRTYLENYATRLNGAEVTIASLDLSFFRREVVLRGIQVTHHVQPMRNLVEVGEVRFNFEWRPLLSAKILIPQMTVGAIRYNTPRETSGIADSNGLTALLDRAAARPYDSVRGSLGPSPLRGLGSLSLGLGARAHVDKMQREFASLSEVKAVSNDFERAFAEWESTVAKLTAAKDETRDTTARAGDRTLAETYRQRIRRESDALLTRLEHAPKDLASDVDLVLRKVGLPKLDNDDFTRELLGRRALNHLERVSYWIDLARRKMIRSEETGTIEVTRAASSLGTEVHYLRRNVSPRFLIQKVVFASQPGDDTYGAAVTGKIVNLSTDPVAHPFPLEIGLLVEVPGLRIHGLRLHGLIDHTKIKPREQVQLTIASFPLINWSIEDTKDLHVGIDSAAATLAFHGQFHGDTLSADWTAQLRHAEFVVSSRYRNLERTLKGILRPLGKSIGVEGSVSGSEEALDLRISSTVGKQLTLALSEEFRHPLRAAEEAIREELKDRISGPSQALKEKIESATRQVDANLADLS